MNTVPLTVYDADSTHKNTAHTSACLTICRRPAALFAQCN